jgi:endonuclease YncB( thermonuclease family)
MRDHRRSPDPFTRRLTGLSPRLVWVAIALLLVLAWMLQQRMGPAPSWIEGVARLIDGDSLSVGGREVRLEGIDAPEGRQSCTRDGAAWACGEQASRHLAQLISGRSVSCRVSKPDQHGRLLATCEAGGRNVNAAMVEDGFALAYGSYRGEEQRARQARRGLWSGEFERPRDWREKQPRR